MTLQISHAAMFVQRLLFLIVAALGSLLFLAHVSFLSSSARKLLFFLYSILSIIFTCLRERDTLEIKVHVSPVYNITSSFSTPYSLSFELKEQDLYFIHE
jgi:hypothetical protein